ncbi:Rpn family recombination-promoting nuclease/putative transposase [Cystobacter fuscus]
MRTGRPLLLYVLLEHQSTVNRWMALRMLRYVVRQVERWRQEHPEHSLLPVILPLVMYHGPEGAWSAPRRVEDLFELPGESEEERAHWRAWVPRFEYLLDDLTAEREEALRARPALHWSGWRGWCCATGGRGNWREGCRSGWASSPRSRRIQRVPNTCGWSSVTCCGPGTGPSTMPRGRCYIQCWMSNARRS